jgi:hypothetical protein
VHAVAGQGLDGSGGEQCRQPSARVPVEVAVESALRLGEGAHGNEDVERHHPARLGVITPARVVCR